MNSIVHSFASRRLRLKLINYFLHIEKYLPYNPMIIVRYITYKTLRNNNVEDQDKFVLW